MAGLSAWAAHGARRIVFLGDFLHSARSHAPATLAAVAAWGPCIRRSSWCWSRQNTTTGRRSPAQLGIRVVDEPFCKRLRSCHHPRPFDGEYSCRPSHPRQVGVRGWDHLRLPCFWFGDAVGVLPAFGAFTGMHAVRRGADDRLFAVADSTVAAMPVARERFAA